MSTIKVNKIENTSTTDGGISIDNSGDVQMSGSVKISGQQMPSTGPLSNRNICENGAMRVAQRGNSKTGITASTQTNVDRMKLTLSTLGTWTSTCEVDGPPGFVRSLKINCTTASATPPSAGAFCLVYHIIEAVNLQPLEYGNSDAKDLTISFWVKSNKTGDASFEVLQPNNSNKMYVTSYNIGVADTWEYKTITIPGDSSGLISDDHSGGLVLGWWLNSDNGSFGGGSNQNAWVAFDQTSRNPSSSNPGVGGAVNDYWQITGLQIEIGSKATPFEHLNYGDYLQRCQRYFLKVTSAIHGGQYATNNVFMIHSFPTQMRAVPTVTASYVLGGGTLSTNFTGPGRYEQYVSGTTWALVGSNSEFSAEY